MKIISAGSRVILQLYVTAFLCLSANEHRLRAQGLTDKKIPVIELKGNAYERGLQHGRQLKNEIATVFTKWKANMRKIGVANPDSLVKTFLAATHFEPAIQQYIPAITEELRGIAEGSGQSYEEVYAFQLVDEFWVYLDKQFNEGKHHCSGIGIPATASHPAWIAQNMDVETYMHGSQVLLHIAATDQEPEQYILSCAGLVALGGMNASGIGMCMNTLMDLQASPRGLPVAFVVRGVLSRSNGKQALEFLKTLPHASGQNYIMGIADSVYDFEASANKVVRFLPNNAKGGVVFHTNHAMVNNDVKPWHREAFEKRLAGEKKSDNSVARFTSLQMRLENRHPSELSADIIKSTLRSKDNPGNPVCVTYNETRGGFTFSSIVYTLGGRRSVQLTYGSPDQAEYVEYFFTEMK